MRDGRTDRRTDRRSETNILPQQLRCAGGIIMSTGWGIEVILAWPMIERGPHISIYFLDHLQYKDHFSKLDIQIKIVISLSCIHENNSYTGKVTWHFNGLMQERRNSIADALELRLSWTNPSIGVLKWPPGSLIDIAFPHQKCLSILELTAFLPPPGGPQAASKVTSWMSWNKS